MDLSGPGIDVKLKERKKHNPPKKKKEKKQNKQTNKQRIFTNVKCQNLAN
jgi:hypothetical protein